MEQTYKKLSLAELKEEGVQIVCETPGFKLEITDEFRCPFCGAHILFFEIKTTFCEIEPSFFSKTPKKKRRRVSEIVIYPIGCFAHCTFPKANFGIIKKEVFEMQIPDFI